MNAAQLAKDMISILPRPINRNVYWLKNRLTRRKRIREWELLGKPVPPPHQYKQIVVEQVSKKYGLENFVETGTFLGHMLEAQRFNFAKLYSIEVEPKLFSDAVSRFLPYKHIKIIQGDSSLKLPEVLREIPNNSVLFWLDGHYSGENTGMGEKQCPIFKELEAIFNGTITKKYILVDDARCFDGKNDYPTINELTSFVNAKSSALALQIIDDIIHIH